MSENTDRWLPLFEWFEASMIGQVVRESLWLFPVIESIHLIAFAALGGAVLVVDLRLLGLVFRSQTAKALAHHVRWLLHGSLAVVITTGIGLFLSEAIKCYYNDPFWIKMRCLALGIVFTYTVRRKVLAIDPAKLGPIWGRVSALVNIGLWSGVAWGGRWIGFWG